MHNLKWSDSEKKVSRHVFEIALEAELAEVMAEFKSKAAATRTPEDMWAVQSYLAQKQREIDNKYDYRYSQLIVVFSTLIREGRINVEQLRGLSEEKLSYIQRILAL